MYAHPLNHLSPLFEEPDMALLPEWIKRGVNAFGVHSLFHTMNLLGLMRVPTQEHIRDIELVRDIPYAAPGDVYHRLDVWRPRQPGLRPCVLFVHGGGFRAMSKDTHWVMARAFARRGFVVFSANYRLAPEHPYPAPLQDVAQALRWVALHGESYGADLEQLTLCGESAGANLILALSLMMSHPFEQPWAREVFELGVTPRAVLPACGILQVTDIERLRSGQRLRDAVVMPQVREAASGYLPRPESSQEDIALASPLTVLEQWAQRGVKPARALPALYAPVGGLDPLKSDSLRVARAAARLGAPARAQVYEGGVHSFMAFLWTAQARRCWEDMFAFIDQALAHPKRA